MVGFFHYVQLPGSPIVLVYGTTYDVHRTYVSPLYSEEILMLLLTFKSSIYIYIYDYPPDQNTDEPLLAFDKRKKAKGHDTNIGNVVPNLIADYAHANDLFDD
jgi:hypothetical protein